MAAQVPAFLRHVTIRKTIPYEVATEIQNHLVTQQLNYKAAVSSHTPSSGPLGPPPDPHILTFGTSPVYTFGRRDRIASLPKSTIESLIAPMPGTPGDRLKASKPHRALLFETQRGGQTTYHGPGQLLIWPIINIKNKWPACGPLDVRGYVRLLEECTIITLKQFGCQGIRTKHPGVWETTGKNKIAALGVHLRRNISSYGVACNLSTDLRFYERIVGCGLTGKGATSIRELTGKRHDPVDFAKLWVANMARLLYGPSPDPQLPTSQPSRSRVEKGTVRMTGIRSEILRRLWYLDAPKKLVQFAQTQKKINISDKDNDSISDEIPSKVIDFNSHKPEVSPIVSNDTPTENSTTTMQTGCPEEPESSLRIQDLLEIHDQKENNTITTPASFRKCAGISYWTPPIGSPSSASVVRKVGVGISSLRGSEYSLKKKT